VTTGEDLYALVDTFRGWVVTKVRRPEDVEDVLSETFLLVYEAMQQNRIRDPERMHGYVAVVLHRAVCREIWRQVEQRQTFQVDKMQIIDENTPETEYRRKERTGKVQHTVDLIPNARRREVVRRFYCEEQPAAVIVREMQITPSQSDTPRGAGGLMSWAVSKTAGPWV